MATWWLRGEGGQGSFGYNAATGSYGDMVKMGIIDPALVAKTAAGERRERGGADADDRLPDRGVEG